MSRERLTHVAESYLFTLVEGNADTMVDLVGKDGVVEDPRFPGNKGEAQIRNFVAGFQDFVASMSPRVEHLRTTATDHRVISEEILHLNNGGEQWELPVAVVVAKDAETDTLKVHVYYTSWPFNKKHSVRRNLYTEPQPGNAPFEGAVLTYVQSLFAGDLEKIRESFEADIYFREASGVPYTHWGRNSVVEYFKGLFANGAPMLRDDTVTDDGRTVVMEFTVIGWNGRERPADRWEAGLAVYERSREGRLCGIRIYDDVEFTY